MAYKILIIDDTRVIRDFLTEVLTDYGYEVDIAEDGQKGIDKQSDESRYGDFTRDTETTGETGCLIRSGMCISIYA